MAESSIRHGKEWMAPGQETVVIHSLCLQERSFIIIKERSGFCRIAMIRKNKGGRLENVIASVGIVITVCIAVFGYYIRTPYLYGQTSDGFLIRQEVEAGTPVTLAYRHSVQKTMIYEYLAVNETEDGLILKSTKYQSMGVGLPFRKKTVNSGRKGNGSSWIK